METAAHVHGAVVYLGQVYTIYREPGRAENVHPFYFGLAKGRPGIDHDREPNCAYASVRSLFLAHGWSARTAWTPA